MLKTQIFDKNEFYFETVIGNVFCVIQFVCVETDKLIQTVLLPPLVVAEESLPWGQQKELLVEGDLPQHINTPWMLILNDMCKKYIYIFYCYHYTIWCKFFFNHNKHVPAVWAVIPEWVEHKSCSSEWFVLVQVPIISPGLTKWAKQTLT